MNSNQTLTSKLNIDEPLKAIKYMISSFFFCSWINRHHSSWLLAYLPAIALKAAAESDVDLTCILFSHNSLSLFWLTSGLKVSTNEWTSWIGCVRWGRQCWGASGKFWKPFQRHVLKCDAYITYCMHAHSFKAALIAFLVTSCLNWRHNYNIACT